MLARIDGRIAAAGGLLFVIGVLAVPVFLWGVVTLFHPGLTQVTTVSPTTSAKISATCEGGALINSCNIQYGPARQVRYYNSDGSRNALAELIGPVGAWVAVLVLAVAVCACALLLRSRPE